MARAETFKAADYPDLKKEDDTAWVAARDALVDDLLQQLAEDKNFAFIAENASTLLCDANPDEPVQMIFGDVVISILPEVNSKDDAEPMFTKVHMHAFDSNTWQIIVSEENSNEREYAVVRVIQPDDLDDINENEKAYEAAVEDARKRAERLVQILSAVEK
jgi:hypothetical protein